MTPECFWHSTPREVALTIGGYYERELTIDRRIRLLRYDTYCLNTEENKRVSIYEYQPIEDDPTPEQIEQQRIEREQEEQKSLQEKYDFIKQHLNF